MGKIEAISYYFLVHLNMLNNIVFYSDYFGGVGRVTL